MIFSLSGCFLFASFSNRFQKARTMVPLTCKLLVFCSRILTIERIFRERCFCRPLTLAKVFMRCRERIRRLHNARYCAVLWHITELKRTNNPAGKLILGDLGPVAMALVMIFDDGFLLLYYGDLSECFRNFLRA